jgi:hypothetical protein
VATSNVNIESAEPATMAERTGGARDASGGGATGRDGANPEHSGHAASDAPASEDHCCKFGRVRDEYGLGQVASELGAEWASPDGDGLRTLARRFDEAVVKQSLVAAGEPPLAGEVENYHRLLVDDATSEADRAQARRRLRKRGVDPDELREDFVSYRTVDRHFKRCSERSRTEPTKSSDEVRAAGRRRLRSLQKRLVRVAEATVADLDDADHIDVGDVGVTVDVTATCFECGDRHPVDEILADGCPTCEDGATSSRT